MIAVRKEVVVAFLKTVVIAGIGGYVFYLVNFPAPWISGSLLFVAAAGLARVKVALPTNVTRGILLVIGMSIGTTVQPDILMELHNWPLSLLCFMIAMVCTTYVVYGVYRYCFRWDRTSAFFASIPGAASYVLPVAATRGADAPKIAFSLSLRFFSLVAFLPAFIGFAVGVTIDSGVTEGAAAPNSDILIALVVCLAAGYGASKIGFPAGWLTGPLIISAVLSASGLLTVQVPYVVLIFVFVLFGAMIGCRFAKIDLRQLKKVAAASIGALAAGFAVSFLAAWIVSWWLGEPIVQVLLAFTPGGIEVMALLAYMMGVDAAYVATHHVARYIAMVLLLPVLTHFVLGPLKNAEGDRDCMMEADAETLPSNKTGAT